MKPTLNSDNEIDIRQVLAALRRQWPTVLIGIVVGLLGASTVNILVKPTWKGEFQIVLSKKERGGSGLGSLAAANPVLSQLAGLGGGGGNSELDTEVKILESPYVLMPVFDFVKSSRLHLGKSTKSLNFNAWTRKNLEIKLAKGTTVLKISYSDKNKELVLPVLQKISREYQSYSRRDRSESLDRGLSYLKTQVDQFRTQAANANRSLDSFSIRYGISNSGNSVASAGLDLGKLLSSSSGRQQDNGAVINLTGGNSETTNFSSQGDPLGQLAAINQELIRRQQQFTDRDPIIIALKRERDAMRQYLENTAGGNLTLPGGNGINKDQAQDIMLSYQELDRAAKRNTAILNSLEQSLLSLQLEKARETKPWELISTPTLQESPASPKPKRNVLLGLIGGFIFGSAFALNRDKQQNRIYNIEELKQLLPYPVLATFPEILFTKRQDTLNLLNLLAEGPLAGASNIALISCGNIPRAEGLAQLLETACQKVNATSKVTLTNDFAFARNCQSQILLAAVGMTKRDEIYQLHQNLQLQGKPVTGLLILSDAS